MASKARWIFLAIGIALFSYLVYNFGVQKIVEMIGKTRWWFLAIIGVWGVTYICNTISFSLILGEERHRVGFFRLWGLVVSGYAINYITPFVNVGGEPYRIMVLKQFLGTHRAISATILYKMINVLSHFFFLIVGIMAITLSTTLSTSFALILGVALLIILSLIVFFFSHHQRGIFELLLRWLSRRKWLSRMSKKLTAQEESLLQIDHQITELYRLRRPSFYGALASDLLGRMVASLEFYFILHAVGFHLSLWHAFYINAAASLLLNLVFFIPFELGSREGSLYLVINTLSIPAQIGIYIALVSRIREFFWILIGLVLSWIFGHQTPHRPLDEMVAGENHVASPLV